MKKNFQYYKNPWKKPPGFVLPWIYFPPPGFADGRSGWFPVARRLVVCTPPGVGGKGGRPVEVFPPLQVWRTGGFLFLVPHWTVKII